MYPFGFGILANLPIALYALAASAHDPAAHAAEVDAPGCWALRDDDGSHGTITIRLFSDDEASKTSSPPCSSVRTPQSAVAPVTR